jgi:hypothetical protein
MNLGYTLSKLAEQSGTILKGNTQGPFQPNFDLIWFSSFRGKICDLSSKYA